MEGPSRTVSVVGALLGVPLLKGGRVSRGFFQGLFFRESLFSSLAESTVGNVHSLHSRPAGAWQCSYTMGLFSLDRFSAKIERFCSAIWQPSFYQDSATNYWFHIVMCYYSPMVPIGCLMGYDEHKRSCIQEFWVQGMWVLLRHPQTILRNHKSYKGWIRSNTLLGTPPKTPHKMGFSDFLWSKATVVFIVILLVWSILLQRFVYFCIVLALVLFGFALTSPSRIRRGVDVILSPHARQTHTQQKLIPHKTSERRRVLNSVDAKIP